MNLQDADSVGEASQIRLMSAEDAPALIAFAKLLPGKDLMFLPRDIRHPAVVAAWVQEIEGGRLVTLLMVRGKDIVGCGTVARDELSWSPHVAEIRCVLSAAMRGQGLGVRLIQETFRTALLGGAEKIVARMTTDQASAIASFEGLGFAPEAILRDHVKDKSGAPQDLVIFAHRVNDVAHRLDAYGLADA